ncbi:DUF3515 domain-containing protein [Jongsikchunia kroppenstedtii]|uniref:DUF3515 domain-containing protein n=1 Tax=Jongsikchunia kroppenstedtii TaxID=1121721 RepID=UPI000380215E|nr:DUF3515 domain-containing protein [Jongsikchunia kroppenstedtii]
MPDSRDPDDQAAPDPASDDAASRHRLSPAVTATLVAIPVMVLVIVLGVVLFKSDDAKYRTDLEKLSASQLADPHCTQLMAELPAHFDGFDDKRMKNGYAEWPAGNEMPGPIQVRCGVDRPAEFNDTSKLDQVNGVQWFTASTKTGADGQLFYCVDHRPYVALWVPNNAGNAAITQLSALVTKHLAPGPLDLGPEPSIAPAPPTS